MNPARIIKKYPNRRLYDTAESRYIAFKDVCRLAAENTPFTVIESTSGHDVTRQVLLQMIADLETRGPALLSTATLMRIVKAHGNGGQEAHDVSALLTAALPEGTRNSG
jgi:polyhydroxyalkanoate synthesis repressor PhaR